MFVLRIAEDAEEKKACCDRLKVAVSLTRPETIDERSTYRVQRSQIDNSWYRKTKCNLLKDGLKRSYSWCDDILVASEVIDYCTREREHYYLRDGHGPKG